MWDLHVLLVLDVFRIGTLPSLIASIIMYIYCTYPSSPNFPWIGSRHPVDNEWMV